MLLLWHLHTHLYTLVIGVQEDTAFLKLLSDSQSEPDPCNTKGHDKRPLDFSVVLFSRHNLTHGLSVTRQMRPWHLGHLSAACGSFSDSLTWHRVVGHQWQLDQEVSSLCSDLRDGRISFNPLLPQLLSGAGPLVLHRSNMTFQRNWCWKLILFWMWIPALWQTVNNYKNLKNAVFFFLQANLTGDLEHWDWFQVRLRTCGSTKFTTLWHTAVYENSPALVLVFGTMRCVMPKIHKWQSC